jgi:hypothetical protein
MNRSGPDTSRAASDVSGFSALGQVILQDRGRGLLDLQEQRVVLVAALEQDDEGSGADAAHPDHLAGQVDDLEPLQQVPPVVLEGGPVGAELLPDQTVDPAWLAGGM